jgi:hypothetical protein
MGKLLTEGYYTELRKLMEQHPDLRDLARELIEAGCQLQDYEGRRLDKRLANQFKEGLAAKLNEIIEGLRKLS